MNNSWSKGNLIGALTIGLGMMAVANFIRRAWNSKRWKKVGVVDQLWVFPLKSGKGMTVNSAEFQKLGLKSAKFKDRTFCIIGENNSFAMSRDFPNISQIEIAFSKGQLCLRAPGMNDLFIDEKDLQYSKEKEIYIKMLDVHIKTILIGEKYDQFISEYVLNKPLGLRLVYQYSPEAQRPLRPKFKTAWPDTFKKGDVPAFSFTTSYTLLTLSSLDHLNQQLDEPVTPERFRSSIIIATDSDQPFQEDNWTTRVRFGNDVILRFNKPCHRCLDITIDPETGKKDPNREPLKTLKQFRLLNPNVSEMDAKRRKVIGESPLFAVNYSLEVGGVAHIGDPVFIEN